jgi:hypothetical protein
VVNGDIQRSGHERKRGERRLARRNKEAKKRHEGFIFTSPSAWREKEKKKDTR